MYQIEAYLKAEERWWLMPYRFASRSEAETFKASLEAKNPGHKFRVVK